MDFIDFLVAAFCVLFAGAMVAGTLWAIVALLVS